MALIILHPPRLFSTAVRATSSGSLSVSIAPTLAATWKEKKHGIEQQTLFEDIVPDALPSDFERYE